MEDSMIIDLFFARDERAIAEIQSKFGAYLQRIAQNILGDPRDGEEAVQSAYLKAWSTIPPNRPASLKLYLGKLTREIGIDLFRKQRAQKRGGGQYEQSLEELSETLAGTERVEDGPELSELARAISLYLRTLPRDSRDMFIMRYYFMDSVGDVAKYLDCTQSKVKTTLFRVRQGLRGYLEKEELI